MSDRIETKRLLLRTWSVSDAQALYQLCLDPELRRSGIHWYESAEESGQVLRHWEDNPEARAIVRREDQQLIGMISLEDMNRYPQYKETGIRYCGAGAGKRVCGRSGRGDAAVRIFAARYFCSGSLGAGVQSAKRPCAAKMPLYPRGNPAQTRAGQGGHPVLLDSERGMDGKPKRKFKIKKQRIP